MALEFLLTNEISRNEMIKIPEGANYYIRKSKTISRNKGRNPRINFFSVNPEPSYRMKKIPENAKYIGFDIEINAFNIEYGKPKFYDIKGNDLKIVDSY